MLADSHRCGDAVQSARCLTMIKCYSPVPYASQFVAKRNSTGDGGVGDGNSDPNTQKCFSNDGKNTYKFLPIFPAR